MRVLVTAAARFSITSDGNLWTPNASLGYHLWSRYLDVYDEVNLLVRAKFDSRPPSGWNMATGPGIKAIPIPYFVGPWEFIKNYRNVRGAIQQALINSEAIHLRLACTVGTEVWRLLPPGRPFGVEVVADPYDVFAPGSVKHPLRPAFRWLFTRELKEQCDGATGALYVTKQALQRRYPCPNYTVGASDVCLPEHALVSQARTINPNNSSLKLVFVGTMAQLYKAPDVLINAFGICVKEGLDLRLVMVGDGKYRTELEAQAVALGVREQIDFRGQLSSSDEVRAELDRADLFVLPSYQEGLPRAMVEAMARALPCIGSNVGGIPELISSEDMVQPGDVSALAQKIREVVTDSKRMAKMSVRNLENARGYRDDVLQKLRVDFCQHVRDRTEVWLKQQQTEPSTILV
jgi:glycosyltransferase involved in cell wall biosynthesis